MRQARLFGLRSFQIKHRGAGTGRQAWLRAMCPLGRVGSIPILGTEGYPIRVAFFYTIYLARLGRGELTFL